MSSPKKVPNFNALSSILDRLAIENVKLGFFENALEHDPLTEAQTTTYRQKAEAQRAMVDVLKGELVSQMEDAFLTGKYEYIAEGRTFS